MWRSSVSVVAAFFFSSIKCVLCCLLFNFIYAFVNLFTFQGNLLGISANNTFNHWMNAHTHTPKKLPNDSDTDCILFSTFCHFSSILYPFNNIFCQFADSSHSLHRFYAIESNFIVFFSIPKEKVPGFCSKKIIGKLKITWAL